MSPEAWDAFLWVTFGFLKWLRCVVVGHRWVSWLDAARPEDRVWGFSKRVCTHCTLVEYAPGAAPGDCHCPQPCPPPRYY